MIKKTAALILALIMVFVMCACDEDTPGPTPGGPSANNGPSQHSETAGSAKPSQSSNSSAPSESGPASAPSQPEPEVEREPEDEPYIPPAPLPVPDIPYPGSLEVDGGARVIDMSFLTDQGYAAEHIFAATDDLLMIFANRVSNGRVSESSYIFTYSLSEDKFTGSSLPVGLVSLYPKAVLDDGTVVVVTMNSETYEYSSIMFVDPEDLSSDAVAAPSISGIRSIDYSGDKTMVAVSTDDALYIYTGDFSALLTQYDGFYKNPGNDPLDYMLPAAVEWLPDSSALLCKLLGYEWVEYPLILYPDGRRMELTEQKFLTSEYMGSDTLLIFDDFSLTPSGIFAIGSQTFTPFTIGDLPAEEDNAYISALAPAQTGDLFGIGVAEPEDSGKMCEARFYRWGELSAAFSLPRRSGYGISFDSIRFTPSGKTAVLMTSATVDTPRAIYFLPLS